MQFTWYMISLDWITRMQRANPDMPRQELKLLCRKNYPFAERRGSAYKAWLRAMRSVFGRTRAVSNKKQMNFKFTGETK